MKQTDARHTPIQNRLASLRKGGVFLSQEQVGKLLGIDGATVSRHEQGHVSLSREHIVAYAALYGVPSHEIFFAVTSET